MSLEASADFLCALQLEWGSSLLVLSVSMLPHTLTLTRSGLVTSHLVSQLHHWSKKVLRDQDDPLSHMA